MQNLQINHSLMWRRGEGKRGKGVQKGPEKKFLGRKKKNTTTTNKQRKVQHMQSSKNGKRFKKLS